MIFTEKMENNLVSIIIPTYNRPELINRAIESVLNQEYKNFELIIIDSSPNDKTRKIIDNLNDPRIIYSKEFEQLGVSKARNKGIINSKGEFICFLDDDDELSQNMLKIQVNKLKDTPENIGFVFGVIVFFEPEIVRMTNIKNFHDKNKVYEQQKSISTIPLMGTLLKRDCFNQIGLLDENLKCGEDWEFMFRVLGAYDYIFTEKIVYIVHYDDKEIKSHLNKNSKEKVRCRKIFLQRNYDELIKSNIILANHYLYIGRFLLDINRFKLSKKYLKKSVYFDPLNPINSLKLYYIFKASLRGIGYYLEIILKKLSIRMNLYNLFLNLIHQNKFIYS